MNIDKQLIMIIVVSVIIVVVLAAYIIDAMADGDDIIPIRIQIAVMCGLFIFVILNNTKECIDDYNMLFDEPSSYKVVIGEEEKEMLLYYLNNSYYNENRELVYKIDNMLRVYDSDGNVIKESSQYTITKLP